MLHKSKAEINFARNDSDQTHQKKTKMGEINTYKLIKYRRYKIGFVVNATNAISFKLRKRGKTKCFFSFSNVVSSRLHLSLVLVFSKLVLKQNQLQILFNFVVLTRL